MSPLHAEALRILGYFWLEELRPEDVTTIASLPELADTLPAVDDDTLIDLAVEYQRLFGFNLPPYESVYIDPSGMLMATATGRVQALYQAAGWTPPPGLRAGAPDHLGLQLLALADWFDRGRVDLACRLHTRHLALWMPVFVSALRRLSAHPFYGVLGDLTHELVLATLPAEFSLSDVDLFPSRLPDGTQDEGMAILARGGEETYGLHDIVQYLLTPYDTGLFVTREDISRMSRALELPSGVGERSRMLEMLFRQAGQYEIIPELLGQLTQLLDSVGAVYRHWGEEHPHWGPYARVWLHRVTRTRAMLGDIM